MLRRENKAVCIVEVKKYNVENCTAQDLVGCKVAAEFGGLDIVYRIVTTYAQWIFLRSFDDKVETEECYLTLTRDGPQQEPLKIIPEKISMISG